MTGSLDEPDEFRAAATRWSTGWPTTSSASATCPCRRRSSRAGCGPSFPPHPPEHGEPWDAIVADLDRIVVPGVTHWQSPNFFGFFPANASGPSVLGDLVSSGLGVQGMLWATSPACTELETHVLDWLVELLGLPERFRRRTRRRRDPGLGVERQPLRDPRRPRPRRTPATEARTAARRTPRRRRTRRSRRRARRRHCNPSSSASSTSTRRSRCAPTRWRRRSTDDVAAGLVPFLVVATVGTTSSLAIDPVARHRRRVRRTGRCGCTSTPRWRAPPRVVPELRPLVNAGLERVDSWCFDPHKWLLTNFDCDVLLRRRPRTARPRLSVLPEYLRNAASESGAVIDYRDWHVPLGRTVPRAEAVVRHAPLRRRGTARSHHEHVESATWLANDGRRRRPRSSAGTDRLALVCFAHRDGDDAGEAIVLRRERHRPRASSRTPGSPGATRCASRSAARTPTQADVERLWELVCSVAP